MGFIAKEECAYWRSCGCNCKETCRYSTKEKPAMRPEPMILKTGGDIYVQQMQATLHGDIYILGNCIVVVTVGLPRYGKKEQFAEDDFLTVIDVPKNNYLERHYDTSVGGTAGFFVAKQCDCRLSDAGILHCREWYQNHPMQFENYVHRWNGI